MVIAVITGISLAIIRYYYCHRYNAVRPATSTIVSVVPTSAPAQTSLPAAHAPAPAQPLTLFPARPYTQFSAQPQPAQNTNFCPTYPPGYIAPGTCTTDFLAPGPAPELHTLGVAPGTYAMPGGNYQNSTYPGPATGASGQPPAYGDTMQGQGLLLHRGAFGAIKPQ